KKVVVEVNFEIINNENYGSFIVKENDSLEVLSFVGGG
ncbi:MAG: sulfur carrier protein ThiS, partial [Clostridium sp.]